VNPTGHRHLKLTKLSELVAGVFLQIPPF